MKCSSLMFIFTSFVLNVCGGQFSGMSGDPAPGRSPGPPDPNPMIADYTTITSTTSHHVQTKYTKQPINPFTTTILTNTTTSTTESRSENHFNEPPTIDPSISSRHREHNLKSHENSAAIHHKQTDRIRNLSPKTGRLHVN